MKTDISEFKNRMKLFNTMNSMKFIMHNGKITQFIITDAGAVYEFDNKKHEFLIKEPSFDNRDKTVRVSLNYDDGSKREYIDRLVAEAFIPNPDNKRWIFHKDGNPYNCKVENLVWITGKERNLIKAIFNNKKDEINIDDILNVTKDENDKPANIKNVTDKQIEEVCKLLEEDKLSPNEIKYKCNVQMTVINEIYCHKKGKWADIRKKYKVTNYSQLPSRIPDEMQEKYNNLRLENPESLLENINGIIVSHFPYTKGRDNTFSSLKNNYNKKTNLSPLENS